MSEQKPDQWQKRHPVRTMGKWENTHEHDAKWWRDNSSGWEIRALYAAPPAQPAPRKMDIPPAPIDALSVAYAEGWNAACDAFFGGLPPLEPLVVTVTQPAQAQPARLSDGDIARHWFATTEEDEIWPSAVKFAHAIAAAVVPPGFVVVPEEPTEAMIAAYLTANLGYWQRTDRLPTPPDKWRTGTPSEATAESYRAMIAAPKATK